MSEEDAELIEAQVAHSSMAWFTFSPEAEESLIMQNTKEVLDISSAQGEKIRIDIDQHSVVSTFATVVKPQENNSLECTETKDLRDDVLAFTTTSYKSRMTNMEQQIENMHEKLDKKLEATTQVLQKSMFDFIKQMLQLKSLDQETNSIKSDKSCADNSAGSKRLALLDHIDNSTEEEEMIGAKRKSPRINPPSQQKLQAGIAKSGEQTTVVISKPGETKISSGKT